MIEYIVGKINYINSTYLILENNFVGYKIFVSDPTKFEINKIQKIYLYTKIYQNNKNGYSLDYYGFKTLTEKIFFETLISINGIGVKIALNILKNNIDILKELIKKQDVNSLSSLEGFNNKIATNVVSQLSYKMNLESSCEQNNSDNTSNILSDVISALKALGYKKLDIEKGISKLNKNMIDASNGDISDLISFAIKTILENENISN